MGMKMGKNRSFCKHGLFKKISIHVMLLHHLTTFKQCQVSGGLNFKSFPKIKTTLLSTYEIFSKSMQKGKKESIDNLVFLS